jgi:CRP-like cAMP-binding protein
MFSRIVCTRSGQFDVYKDEKNEKTEETVRVKKHTYPGSGYFGELALLYNQPRQATVIAQTDGIIWALVRWTYTRIFSV